MLATPVSRAAPCCVVPSALFRASSVNTISPKSMLPLVSFRRRHVLGHGSTVFIRLNGEREFALNIAGVKPSAWLKLFTPVTFTDTSPVPYVFSKANPLSPASIVTASTPEPASTALMVNGIDWVVAVMPRSESPSVFSYAMHGIVQVASPLSLVAFVAEPFANSSFSFGVSKFSAPNATVPSAASLP